jgi:hypothetical protein
MKRLLMFAFLPTLMYAQSAPVPATEAKDSPSTPISLPDQRTAPLKGKATIIGGTVTKLDLVRDELTVRVFGSKQTMKILFDPRTHVFRDGTPVSLHDLRNEDHVSVETRSDGSDVFAQSIHVFAHSTTGECSGQVLSYDSGKGEIVIRDALASQPVKLRVSSATTISGTEKGPAYSLADLKEGVLVTAKFSSDEHGKEVARQLIIQAVPGATFTFSGSVAYLDVHSGVLVLTDPRDKKTYEISFDQGRTPIGQQVHEGSDVTVAALFDGSHYRATAITANPAK